MNELTKLDGKDLLANERVRTAYIGLVCDQGYEIWGVRTKPTLSSLADVAFAMRDACAETENYHWLTLLVSSMDIGQNMVYVSTPKQWIIAAVRCYEATQ